MDLVLGTAQLCTPYGAIGSPDGPQDLEHVRAMLGAALRLGVAAIDTAPVYGDAERFIGNCGTTLAIHTKLSARVDPAESLASSLARLGSTSVDVLYLHDPAAVLQRQGGYLDAAHEFVGNGAARLGASTYEIAEFDAAVADPRIEAVQVPMNLFDRRIGADRLKAAVARGTAVYARSLLLQGALATDPVALPRHLEGLRASVAALQNAAVEMGRSVLELAFGWVRAQGSIAGAVVGCRSVGELATWTEAAAAPPLTEAELANLRSLPVPEVELCDPRRWGTLRG